MAAYAAVVCLMNNMEQMQNHPCHSFSFDQEQIECLRQNVGFLLDFLATYSHGGSKEEEALESQIASAAQEADDVIESHIVDQILAGSTVEVVTSFDRLFDDFLDFFQAHQRDIRREVEASESQIASEAYEADDAIESHIGDEILAGSTLHRETRPGEWLMSLCHDFLETYSPGGNKEAETLESQIASAAHEDDDVVESHIVHQSLAGSTLHGETSLRGQIKSLSVDLLETSSQGSCKEGEASESQLDSAAHDADDVIESHTVDRSLAGSTLHGETSSCFLDDLQKVIENMDSLKQMVMKVEAQSDLKDQPCAYSAPAASSRPLTPGKNAMVGFDEELIKLMDLLTRQQSSRQIISITGMGGIGKTTLAKNAYENSVIVHHFDIHIWATISQKYSTKKNLSELICLGKKSDAEKDKKTEDELGEQLFKCLWGRRYLIILDDIWSVEAWDNIQLFFPDNNNSSRIVVTSRQSDVANNLGSSCIALKFLDEEKSWNLFCQRTFADLDCPPELEETGKKIVKRCRGLPLLIVLIGGHLGNTCRTEQYWENVAKDINSTLESGDDDQCFDILTLSYNYLSAHLKPCFLYMGIFPEDYEISVSTLVKLWVAEGFLKPSKTQCLEEVAEVCLNNLVDMNLVQVRKWRWNGKIKTCSIHDLLRELCLKVAAKEKFFHLLKLHQTPPPINEARRLVVHGSTPQEEHYPEIFRAMESAQLTRSLLCHSTDKGQPCTIDYRLLKVMQSVEGVADEDNENFMELKLQQVNLRYLDCRLFYLIFHLASTAFRNPPEPVLPLLLPSSIFMLWNLQTLIVSGYPVIVAPPEIWKMPQLRHIAIHGLHMADPSPSDDFVALENLHTLFEVINFRLSKDVCKRIPNIKKLRIGYSEDCEESSYYSPHNLGCLQKLESLRCSFSKKSNWRHFSLSFTFPSSLHKLCLENCFLEWDDLTIIGLLPHLEVLKLCENAAVGSEWNPVEGEFLRLKFLSITSSDLFHWNAESCHFPVLEKLFFYGSSALDEIPSDIGEIPTLQFICLKYCSMSAPISAMRILVEQESLGNEDLRGEVMFSDEEQLESFREIVQAEDLSSGNLYLHC
ncbi:hypothetical protein ACS0TY_007009 [Phlomoides rotata]